MRTLITGITGQIGSHLADLLVAEGHEVYGMVRRSSTSTLSRIEHLIDRITLHQGDLLDQSSLELILNQIEPEWIVNCAAQSHVHVSFGEPTHTTNVTALGVLRLLEAARTLPITPKIVQMSSSEMFGEVLEEPQSETTRFNPRSPYACAKAYAHYLCGVYRAAYQMHISCAINFNTEGPRRGLNFVTRKITHHIARQSLGLTTDSLELGNLGAKRDWSHVEDNCRALYLMLQQDKPDDYVIATGKTHTVREFVEAAYKASSLPSTLTWRGEGAHEEGVLDFGEVDAKGIAVRGLWPCVQVNPKYYRPADVQTLTGDPTKAKTVLGWEPQHDFQSLVKCMVEADLEDLK